jgi:hypothetical protein
MRCLLIVLAIIVVIAGPFGPSSVSVLASGHAQTVSAKKHCKIVKKHGHKKKVCTMAKKPTSTPTNTPTLSRICHGTTCHGSPVGRGVGSNGGWRSGVWQRRLSSSCPVRSSS